MEMSDKISVLLDKMYARMTAVCMIYLQEDRYEMIKTDDFLSRILNQQGSLKEAYSRLFLAIREGERVSNAYEAFRDQSIFKRENQAGTIRLIDGEE